MDRISFRIILGLSDLKGYRGFIHFIACWCLGLFQVVASPWESVYGQGPVCACCAGRFLSGGAVGVVSVRTGKKHLGTVRLVKLVYCPGDRSAGLIVRVQLGQRHASWDSAVFDLDRLWDVGHGKGMLSGDLLISGRCLYLFPCVCPRAHVVHHNAAHGV